MMIPSIKPRIQRIAFVGLLGVLLAGVSYAADQCESGTIDREAGPIWDQQDAEGKCPSTCSSNGGYWNGQWRTTVPGEMSVCGCSDCCKDVEAGPIWNQQDAEGKCPSTCSAGGGTWNGAWVTTRPGEMSVCGCCGGSVCPLRTKDLEAGPIWNNDDAKAKCEATCGRQRSAWTGQWRTTVQGEMSVCECSLCARPDGDRDRRPQRQRRPG